MRAPPPISDLPRYPVTGGTILLAVGVTVAKASGVDVAGLYESALVQHGQVWRLVTSALPHGGLFHLAFNCYWTWVFGTLVEAAWGSLATAGVFVLLAAGSGGAEFAVLNGGIGLSGVGYGLFGLVWVLGRRDRRFLDGVDARTAGLFAVWFVICIATTYTGLYPVANVAHAAGWALGMGLGAAAGGVVGWRRQVAAAVGVGVLTVAAVIGATVGRPWVNRSAAAAADNAYQGWVALDQHRDAEAVRWLTDAARMGPGMADTWHNLGVAEVRVGRPDEAAAAFNRAAKLKGTDQPTDSTQP